MSAPVLPTIIRGPGIVVFNSYSYYFGQEGVKVSVTRPTEDTKDDFYGNLFKTSHGSPMVDLTFTPTGMVRSLDKPFPYGPTNLVATWYSGQSILTGSVYIQTKAGVKTLYAKAGISKSPVLFLNPRKQLFGPMTISAINQISVQPTDAAALKTISSVAFNDTNFDETTIVKDIYTATLGSRSSPYDAMGARDGFEIEAVYEIEDVPDVNVGVADKLIHSVEWHCRFAPNNLTEAQVDALAQWQDTGAIIAGQSVSRGPSSTPENLVIDSDVLTATLYRVGVVKAEHGFGARLDRNGQIDFVTSHKFTTGAVQTMADLVVN